MKVISFIERRQQDIIEQILCHCGLWEGPVRTLATARAPPPVSKPRPATADELELVADDDYLEFQRRENEPGELQLVLDPEFL